MISAGCQRSRDGEMDGHAEMNRRVAKSTGSSLLRRDAEFEISDAGTSFTS